MAEAMGKCLILYHWMMEGSEDESMHQEGWGGLYRFDPYVLQINDRGFVSFEEYEDSEKLQKAWDEWYNDGWGASEDDIYLQWDRFKGWQIWSSWKEIPVQPSYGKDTVTRNRALAAASLHMRDTGYYPDEWETGERGGSTNISKEVRWLA